MSSDEVVDDDSFLSFGRVFEADDDHAVALGAFSPAVGAVVFADFADFDQREVAVCADVVVAYCVGTVVGSGALCFGWGRVAGTMEACVRGRDWVGANIAVGCEGQRDVVCCCCNGGAGGAGC